MVTVEQVREALSDRNYMAVHRATGVSWHTIRGIASGANENPKYETVRILAEYLFNGVKPMEGKGNE